MCYTNCGCSCGCSATCGCYESVCPSCHSCSTTTTTTTTTINPDCEPCDTFYDCECVIYSGGNIQCYGLQTGDNLCEILDVILSHLPQCTTTTTAVPLNCTFTAIASLTRPTTTSTTSTTSTSTSTSSTTSTSTSSTTSTSTSSTSTTSTTTTTTCSCYTITNTYAFPSDLVVTYCGQANSTTLSIGASSTVIACLSSYVPKAGVVAVNCGTSCTSSANCTFCTTSTTSTTTSTTTTSTSSTTSTTSTSTTSTTSTTTSTTASPCTQWNNLSGMDAFYDWVDCDGTIHLNEAIPDGIGICAQNNTVFFISGGTLTQDLPCTV